MVFLASPTNRASFSTTNTISFSASASSIYALTNLTLYDGSQAVETTHATNLSGSLSGLAAGSHSVFAVATDINGTSATSVVAHLTVNLPGSTLIDFEGLNAMAGPVGGAGLSSYLALFGVKATNVTANTSLAAFNDQVFLGGGVVTNAPGDGNFLAQTGASGPVSYTLLFAPCASVSWVRDGLLAGTTGASLPGWRAHIFDAEGNVLGSAGESALGSFTNLPAAARGRRESPAGKGSATCRRKGAWPG